MERKESTKFGVSQLVFGSLRLDGYQCGFPDRYEIHEGKTINLGNTTDRGVIPWTVVGDVLMCNMNLLTEIRWDTLNEVNLIFGRTVHIDGFRFRCRVPISDHDGEAEWEEAMKIANGTDSFWHWKGNPSWNQLEIDSPQQRLARGGESAIDYRWLCLSETCGWRPVLEPRGLFFKKDEPEPGVELLIWGCGSVVRGTVLEHTPYDILLKSGSGWSAPVNPMFQATDDDLVIIDRAKIEFFQVLER